MSRRPEKNRLYTVLAVCGFLLLAVVLVFGQTLRHEFVNLDDNEYVYENHHVLDGLTRDTVVWAMAGSHAANWHPLTWLSHMFDGQIYGASAGGHHVTNVILHAAAAILLLLVLWRMTGDLWPSALAAAIFAIHPQHVESVAWVAERKDILSGLFFVLTLGAYVGYARHQFSIVRYLAVVVLFALGLMAKPMLVTLPFVLLLLDYWPLRRMVAGTLRVPSARPTSVQGQTAHEGQTAHGVCLLLVEKIPLFALAAASCAVTIWAQAQVAAFRPAEHLPWGWLAANAVVSYVAYLLQAFYPVGLAVYYPHPGRNLPVWEIVGAALLLLAISTACVAWVRKRPYLFVGWFWYLGMLVPVIGLVQVGAQGRADRYTYLPQIGLCIALVWLLKSLCCRHRTPHHCNGGGGGALLCVASALMVAALTACAWRQTSFWRDSVTLWTHALKCTSDNHFAHNSLGAALDKQDRADEAIEHYRQAIEICPGYAKAHNNLGIDLYKKKKLDEAVQHCRMAVEIDPLYAEAHNNLGAVLHAQGNTEEAIKHVRKALDIDVNYAMAHNNLGAALVERGRPDEAIAHYRKALEIQPDYAEAYYNLGVVLAGRSQFDEAMAQYRKVLEIEPGYVNAYNNLGNALVSRGRLDEAMAQYRKVLEVNPDHAEAHYNLANILARRGRLDEAIVHYQKGLKIKPNDAKAQHNLGVVMSQRERILKALAGRRKSLRLNPNDVALLNDTAWLLATNQNASLRNGPQAVELAQRAAKLSGGRQPAILDTLAAAYAEAGRFPEAVQMARKALELAGQQNKPALMESIRAKIQLYKAGTPFREPPPLPVAVPTRP